MGITGLLPFLKKASKKSHIRHFSGQTVAVDGSCWLHKGAYGCAQKLGLGEPTVAYVTYFIKYVNVLRGHGLRPILVFDGRSLPSKEETNRKRRERREENRQKAKEALRVGNKREAWECFQRSIEITPAMVREVIKVLRQEKLDYIISPYESDAQLAHLSRQGIVDLVITEDSDLVLFGCPKIFFKMNADGEGVIFDQSKLHLCMDTTPEKFQFEKFRQMCIFSGCDYLESLAGIGLGKAKKVFTLTTHNEIDKILKQAPSLVKIDITVTVMDEYIKEFVRAENTFLYQLVFDPRKRELCPLTPYPKDIDETELSYCGKYETDKVSLDMALGNLDIKTLQRVDYFNIDDPKSGYHTDKSMWSKKYKNTLRLNSQPKDFKVAQNKPKVTSTSPRKIVTISASRIFKNHVEKSNKITVLRDPNDDEKEGKTSSESESYEMCRSPPTKRICLRSFYSKETKVKINNDVDKFGTKSPRLSLPLPPIESVSTTDSDDSQIVQLKSKPPNPFAVKSPDSSQTKARLSLPLNDSIHKKSPINNLKPNLRNRSVGLAKTNLQNEKKKDAASLLQSEIRVSLEKIDSKSVRTSPYFTEGAASFLGSKNHAIYVAKGKRTSF